jgi:hypothetical protein
VRASCKLIIGELNLLCTCMEVTVCVKKKWSCLLELFLLVNNAYHNILMHYCCLLIMWWFCVLLKRK